MIHVLSPSTRGSWAWHHSVMVDIGVYLVAFWRLSWLYCLTDCFNIFIILSDPLIVCILSEVSLPVYQSVWLSTNFNLVGNFWSTQVTVFVLDVHIPCLEWDIFRWHHCWAPCDLKLVTLNDPFRDMVLYTHTFCFVFLWRSEGACGFHLTDYLTLM